MTKTWWLKLTSVWKKIIQPQNTDEDKGRQERILTILIIISIICFAILSLIRFLDWQTNFPDRGLPLAYKFLLLLAFVGLYKLVRLGRINIASWLLIFLYSIPMFYFYIFSGADSPAALILSVLIIILSGILLGERPVLISAAAISVFLILLTELQLSGKIKFANYWRQEKHEFCDAIAYVVLLIIATTVIWLFCHEIKKALDRARQSELELRQERDSLEIKILDRTRELRQLEAEKIFQLYRLAEFGRLSSGIFHDLVNPLTAVSLNLEQIRNDDDYKILVAKSHLHQALLATKKMADLLASIKKQIQYDSQPSYFLLNLEIEQIIQILAYKARQAKVSLILKTSPDIYCQGEAIKFGQIMINLLANAIEACVENAERNSLKKLITIENEVLISLNININHIFIEVQDNGIGISPDNIDKIFEPFFSTKQAAGYGLGLGLASTKNIIEKCFSGLIEVKSELDVGTIFTVKLPILGEKML